MRRREFLGTDETARALFDAAEVVHLAGADAEGRVVLKTVHGVVDDGWLCFHAAPAGEKLSLLGREIVVTAEEVVARVPSFFIDPVRACPATTLFRSAQLRGVLTAIDAPGRKARVLQRLMEKLQPEGGHAPITAEHPLYSAAVRGLLVAGLPLEGAVAKVKLGQNRDDASRSAIVEHLWRRGAPTDARAIELLLAANPTTPRPAFLRGPAGTTLRAHLDGRSLPQALGLLEGTSWNHAFSRDELARAHLGSAAWVGAVDAGGALVATARATSDGGKYAWVYDVCVRTDRRREGVGQALVRLLLAHPAVRRCRRVRLGTRDAQPLYRRFGFVDVASLAGATSSSELVLVRQEGAGPPLAEGPAGRGRG
ncbi:MAG: GNAT family N-acetyltransferase [Myxococcaceae bacterium]|nr:GNAT family N-acetyltransferase [Myxococcaceae bacterium]